MIKVKDEEKGAEEGDVSNETNKEEKDEKSSQISYKIVSAKPKFANFAPSIKTFVSRASSPVYL